MNENEKADLEMLERLFYTIEIHINNFIGRVELNNIYGGAVELSIHARCIEDWAKDGQALIKKMREENDK